MAELDCYGKLRWRPLLAHCVQLTGDEVARLSKTGTFAAH